MSTLIISERSNAQIKSNKLNNSSKKNKLKEKSEEKEKIQSNKTKTNFFTSKTFPNYLFLISIVVIIGLSTGIIVMAVNSNSKPNSNNNEESEGNLTPWKKYKKAEKYLYIWEYWTPDYILRLCQEHHFTRVYLNIGCIDTFWEYYFVDGNLPAREEIGSLDYETFIKKLNNINVEVELVTFLDKNANDFTNVDRTINVANIIKQLSKKVKIKALHFDQEPGDSNSYEDLLKMYKNVNEIFPTSAILRPFWLKLKMSTLKDNFKDEAFYNSFSDCETLVDAIMKVTSFTDLMAYNHNYDTVTGYMETLKQISSRHPNNEAKNVVEISGEDYAPAEDTLYQRYVEDHDTFFNFIYNSSKLYGGITIHYYETWYKNLYCVWPDINIDYDGGEPKNC